MKTRSFVLCLLFFISVGATAQVKYGVEFVGGMNYGGLGIDKAVHAPYAITGGVGVVINVNREVEIVGNTLFTYFPPGNTGRSAYYFIPYPTPADRKAYSCEILVGPRFNGHGSSSVHPFLVLQGGMQLLRLAEQTGDIVFAHPEGQSVSQFLDIHGTEDIQLRGVINVGGGVQFVPSQSIRLNLQATYKLIIGKESSVDSFIPVTLSVILPV